MSQLDIALKNEDNEISKEFILNEAGNTEIHRTNVSRIKNFFCFCFFAHNPTHYK